MEFKISMIGYIQPEVINNEKCDDNTNECYYLDIRTEMSANVL